MLKNLEFKIFFLTLILLPFFYGIARNILFIILILIITRYMISDLLQRKFKVSLKKEDIQGKILIVSFFIVAYTIINVILNGFTIEILERLIQLYTCIGVLIFSSTYHWDEKNYKFCLKILKIIILSCMCMYPFLNKTKSYYSGLFSSGNSLGGAIFCYFGIFLSVKRKYTITDYLTIIAGFILMYLSQCRSALIALLFFIIFRFIFHKRIIKHKNYIFYILIIIFTLFPFFYVELYNSNLRTILNDVSREYFHKNFFSGRQITWQALLNAIKQKLFIGYGLDMMPEQITGFHLSSHNWYIQILLQFGIIGYMLIIDLLIQIWKTINVDDNYSSLTISAFMIGLLVWQCFEVSLTQNNIYIGILAWFIMGLGVNEKIKKLKIKTE